MIGKNGANIKKIRDSTGARIVFPTDKDEDKEVITIIGKKEAVEKAKAELEATIKEIVSVTVHSTDYYCHISRFRILYITDY